MSVVSLTEYEKSRNTNQKKIADSVFHLPVAPQVVARTRFSPPPPPSNQFLMVPQALELLNGIIQERRDAVSMVAISGPGDPLATPDITLGAIKQVRKNYPDLKIGLRTLGIGSDKLAADLAQAGADYIEVEVNGVRSEVLQKLYAWIRPGLKTLKIDDAVELLIKEQRNGIPALKFHDLSVVVSTTLYPGYNMDHITKISSEVLELGADAIALSPYSPEIGSEVSLEPPSKEMIIEVEERTQNYLPLTEPLLLQKPADIAKIIDSQKQKLPKPTKDRPNVAVASSNGIEVDLHLGHAIKILIYGPREDGLNCLLSARDAPEPGSGRKRWEDLAALLSDCFTLLVASAGETPRSVLEESGLKVLITEDNIEGTVDVLYGGGKKGKKK